MCKQYKVQAAYNRVAFLTDPEYRDKLEILKRISTTFEEEEIRWALSCSAALFFRGIVDDFGDYDLLFHVDDVERAKEVMSTKCEIVLDENTPQRNSYFASPYYQQAKWGEVEFDLIADISVKTFGGLYTYKVDQGLEMNSLDGNFCLPLIPIEAQMVLYGMMEGWQAKRRFKRELCLEYLQEMKISQVVLRYEPILRNALEQKIPADLKEVINTLLSPST